MSRKTTRVLRYIQIAAFAFLNGATAACGNDRSVKFEQVHTGGNGPRETSPQYFSSVAEIDNSWVKNAVDPPSYRKILSKINFEHQLLMAFPIGEMPSFSGEVKISNVYQYTGGDSLPMNAVVQVGLLGEGCRNDVKSFPFALVVIYKPAGFHPLTGYDIANFNAGCPTRTGRGK